MSRFHWQSARSLEEALELLREGGVAVQLTHRIKATAATAEELVEALCAATHCQALILDSLPLSALLPRLSLLFTTHAALTHFSLWATPITAHAASAMASALQHNRSLQLLDLENTSLAASSAATLAPVLSAHRSLTCLNLSGNHIDHCAFPTLACVLLNPNLHTLNLSKNLIGAQGCKALAKNLVANCGLRCLELEGVGAEEEGAKWVLKSARSQTLRINLRDNGITGEFFARFTVPLQELVLPKNAIASTACSYLASSLNSSALVNVNLSHNLIGDRGVAALAKALSSNERLRVLDLSYNTFGSEGCEAIASALAQNQALTTLDLSGIKIRAAASALLQVLSDGNDTLLRLRLVSAKLPTKMHRLRIQRAVEHNREQVKTRQRNEVKAAFLAALERNEKGPLMRSKLMMIGSAKAGKTATGMCRHTVNFESFGS